MRHALLILSALLCLPATPSPAAPYAEYNPTTGDFRVKGLSSNHITHMRVRSASGVFDVNYSIASIELFPSRPLIPQYLRMDARETYFLPIRFDFESVLFHGLVPPMTPIEDLTYLDTYNAVALRKGTITQVPEPAAMATLLCGLTALILQRRWLNEAGHVRS